MDTRPHPKPPAPQQDFSGPAGFAKAIRGLSQVPKKDVDNAIARERADKKKAKRR